MGFGIGVAACLSEREREEWVGVEAIGMRRER